MVSNIVLLPDDILLRILGYFRRPRPSYFYRVLPQQISILDEVHSRHRRALLAIAATCQRLGALSKMILFEDFVPLQIWPSRPPFMQVRSCHIRSEQSGLRYIRNLYIELPCSDVRTCMRLMRIASSMTRLHLGVLPSMFNVQTLTNIFMTLVCLETVTLAFLSPTDVKGVDIYNALGHVPHLRYLSVNTLEGMLAAGQGFCELPLKQLEFRDLKNPRPDEARAVLNRLNTDHLQVLALLNCDVAEDCLRGLLLPSLGLLRLHGGHLTQIPDRKTLEALPCLRKISMHLPILDAMPSRIARLPRQLECLQIIKSTVVSIARVLELVSPRLAYLPCLRLISFSKPYLKGMSPSKALAISKMLQWLGEKGIRVEPAVELREATDMALSDRGDDESILLAYDDPQQ